MRRLVAGLAILPLLALGACSEANTDSTQQAIRYAGGATDAETFKNCQSGAKLDYGSPGDKIYYYPAAQRTFTFTDAQGAKAESPPLSVSTKNPGQEVTIRGYVTFQMTTDCAKIQAFHELIGKRMGADFTQGAQEDDGWSAFLAQYFGLPINEIFDSVGAGYTWQELYGNKSAGDPKATPAVPADNNLQLTVQNTVRDQLSDRINANIGEGTIKVTGVDIQRPDPDAKLLDALRAAEQARADANTRVTQAEEAKRIAVEDNKTRKEEARADRICRQNYTAEQCTVQKLAQQDQLKNYRPNSVQVETK